MAVERVSKNKAVYITYAISDTGGTTLERIEQPVGYLHGVEQWLHEKMEAALEGCVVGDSVNVMVEGDSRFGDYDPNLVFTDSISNVPEQFRRVGAQVELTNDRGEKRLFFVSKIENGQLTMDGNHPYAGKTLNFNVLVVEVRDATEDELESGQVAPMGAPSATRH